MWFVYTMQGAIQVLGFTFFTFFTLQVLSGAVHKYNNKCNKTIKM